MKVARFKEKIGEKVGSEVEIFRDRKSKKFQIEKFWDRKFWKFTVEIINIFKISIFRFFKNFENVNNFNSKFSDLKIFRSGKFSIFDLENFRFHFRIFW